MQDYDSSAKSYLSQNLNVIMSVWKMDQQAFAEVIGLNYPTFNNYMAEKSFPRVPTLLVISDVTGIPIDIYLRQLIPIHLIPERPLKPGEENTNMVKEHEAIYRAVKPPLLDYSVLESRIERIEQQIGHILDKLPLPEIATND